MKRLSTIRNILLLCATVLLGGCDLTETMQVEADKSMVFGSESGLRLYAYSFYRALPTLSTGYQQDEMCDIAAVRQMNVFISAKRVQFGNSYQLVVGNLTEHQLFY